MIACGSDRLHLKIRRFSAAGVGLRDKAQIERRFSRRTSTETTGYISGRSAHLTAFMERAPSGVRFVLDKPSLSSVKQRL